MVSNTRVYISMKPVLDIIFDSFTDLRQVLPG